MEDSDYSELKRSLSAISVKALNYSSRLKLAYNLDSRQVLLSEKGFSRDYRGLAELIGFQFYAIKKFGEFEDRTMKVLESWETRPDATLDKLITYLEDMDRHDIIHELIPSLKKNVEAYLEHQKTLEIPIKNAEDWTECGACVSYKNEDRSVANQFGSILKSPENCLKLPIRGRNMLTEMLELERNIDLIKNRLTEESKEKNRKIQKSIQISFRHPDGGDERCKTIIVDNRLIVQETGIKDSTFRVKTDKDDFSNKLIGDELTFSNKQNFVRELLRNSEFDLKFLNSTDDKCSFIFRENTSNSSIKIDLRLQIERKKNFLPQNKINWLFKKPAGKHVFVDSGNKSPTSSSLFSLPLWKLCSDNNLPKPIMSMLVQLFLQGPHTEGIFRLCAPVRKCKEIKEKLESDPECDIKKVDIIALSSVFKQFLRSLPDCVLHSKLYKHWLKAISCESESECKKRVLSLIKQLPPSNLKLLQYLLCLLWHIAQHASKNKMHSRNLAVCISPTLLNPGKFDSSELQQVDVRDVARRMTKVVAFLIDHCVELFGKEVLQLLGTFPESDGSCQDSNAAEADSLHSLQYFAGADAC